MRILLALSKIEVRERVSFSLEARYREKPLEAGTAREAIELLAHHKDVDLVICEYPGISDVLFRHLVSQNRRRGPENPLQVVICAAALPKEDPALQGLPVAGFASWGALIDGIYRALDPLFGKAGASEATSLEGEDSCEPCDVDYCQIQTSLLIRVGQLRTGVYIRLSATKYVKLFQEGDEFEEEDYRRFLKEKKLEHLYLRRDECSEFITKFNQDLLLLLQSEIAAIQVTPDLLEAIHETVHELFSKLGATPEVQQIVKTNVQLAVKSMSRSTRLADVLTRFQVEKGMYISSHSTLLPQIACTLASGMEWKSDLTYQKLSLAGFLHDISLQNHELAAVTNLTELAREKERFTEDERKAYRNHPLRGSEFAKIMTEVPPDVDLIIMQHHEQPDGSGFPRGLTHSHISPLSSVFIVAHDMVNMMYARKGGFVLEEFLESVKDRYQGSSFRKLMKALTDSDFGS